MIKISLTSACLLISLSLGVSTHASEDMPEWQKELYRNRTSPFTPQETWDLVKDFGKEPSGPRPGPGWIPQSNTQSSQYNPHNTGNSPYNNQYSQYNKK